MYVLIDRRSQSAATIMAIRLSMISKAIKDYFSRKDPILDFALKYKPSPVAKISTVVADPDAEGKYHYSALQVIHISKEGTAWKMVIEDGSNINFLNTNLYLISKEPFLRI